MSKFLNLKKRTIRFLFDMHWKDTPIFVLSFNRLELGLRQLIDWLKSAEMTNITIIDNKSTYPPLLEYYETLKDIRILRMTENYGHDVFWRLGYHTHQQERFIVTDPDVVPDPMCPKDLVLKMHIIADTYKPAKVGPAIRIDNLPDHYHLKNLMLRSECGYWAESRRAHGGCFEAPIDTTFALYEPAAGKWDGRHFRLDFPYVANHLPWYQDLSQPNPERDYYRDTVLPGISHSQ